MVLSAKNGYLRNPSKKKPLHASMQGPRLKNRKAFIPPWASVEPFCAAFWAFRLAPAQCWLLAPP